MGRVLFTGYIACLRKFRLRMMEIHITTLYLSIVSSVDWISLSVKLQICSMTMVLVFKYFDDLIWELATVK